MPVVTPIRPKPLGNGAIRSEGASAGGWVFLTGHFGGDLEAGVAPEVAGNPALPLHGQARYRREGDFIYRHFTELLGEAGLTLADAVRLDQYYPTHQAVDPYHRARKAAFKVIPPSTSVLMEEMLIPDCAIDVSLLAMRAEATAKVHAPGDVPVPPTSGFVPSLVRGDYVFVAGQMANAASGDGMDPRATKPSTTLWNGTEIRLQTEFLIGTRLRSALEAGGSSLKNAIKAQVYLSDMADTPEFLDVWNKYFAESPCALSIVPTSGFGFMGGIIEINILGLRDDAAVKKEIIDVGLSPAMAFSPAVKAGDLLCLPALVAADENGPLVPPALSRALRHVGGGAKAEMKIILEAASKLCAKAGTKLENVLRAHHFMTSLYDFPTTQFAWAEAIPGTPVPAGAVRVPDAMPVPGCTVMLDMWAYVPPA